MLLVAALYIVVVVVVEAREAFRRRRRRRHHAAPMLWPVTALTVTKPEVGKWETTVGREKRPHLVDRPPSCLPHAPRSTHREPEQEGRDEDKPALAAAESGVEKGVDGSPQRARKSNMVSSLDARRRVCGNSVADKGLSDRI